MAGALVNLTKLNPLQTLSKRELGQLGQPGQIFRSSWEIVRGRRKNRGSGSAAVTSFIVWQRSDVRPIRDKCLALLRVKY